MDVKIWCLITLAANNRLVDLSLYDNEESARKEMQVLIDKFYNLYGEYCIGGLDKSVATWLDRRVLLTNGVVHIK